MNFICERPYVFFVLILSIPVILFANLKNIREYKIEKIKNKSKIGEFEKRIVNYHKVRIIRSLFFTLSWTMLIFAYSKISWGSNLIPVQKNGNAVSFVFDISNSMMAKDGPQNISRLEAASIYANKLLQLMGDVPISVIIAKGSGINAIPLTEDKLIVESLLDELSPSLMTVPGSSIGKGIMEAKKSFPEHYSSAAKIWVFTDCEETVNQLGTALSECIKSGISVSIIGFGSEDEIEVLAGDGKTKVKTSLKSANIKKIISRVRNENSFIEEKTQLFYYNSLEKGSAVNLLSQINGHNSDNNKIISYETELIPRYKTFLLLAIIFFVLGIFFTEADFSVIGKSNKTALTSVIFVIFLTGCSSDTFSVLKGTLEWQQKHYRQSIGEFLKVIEKENQNNNILNYVNYDLGTTYCVMDEDGAAMKRYSLVGEDAATKLQFSVNYNSGIIAYKNGKFDEARDYFRKALEIDSSSINAKINMEITMNKIEIESKNKEPEVIPASENNIDSSEMENEILKKIKENSRKQWENSNSNQVPDLENDY